MKQIENARVDTAANVYFDGRCVSYNLHLDDGVRKSVGVIFPAQLTFGTAAPEQMDVVQGRCRVKLPGSETWVEVGAGESFQVPGESSFDIEVLETLHYICHYG